VAKVLVIGGGLVGPVAAMFLARLGHDVQVWEKRSDSRHTHVDSGTSVNLTLCERGLASLAELGLDRISVERCVPIFGRLIHHDDGRRTFQPYSATGRAIYSIARSELHRILVGHAERHFDIRFVFGRKCVDVDPRLPAAHFAATDGDGVSTQSADVVIAADGVHSAVRACLQRAGIVGYTAEELEYGYKEIHIEADADGGGWVTDRQRLHLWPRGDYMFIGFPNIGGGFTGSLHLPFTGEVSFDMIRHPRQLEALFETAFPDVLPYAPRLAEEFFHRPVNRMTTIRCAPWHVDGTVLLLGDAAHAIYPVYGQGANAGFEDCRLLARCLEEADGGWSEAFARYWSIRKSDLDAMADLCVSHTLELRAQADDPRFQLRKRVERRVSEIVPDLYQPLYVSIAFSCSRYADAVHASERHERMIDRLMAIDDIEERLESGNMARTIRDAFAAVPAGSETT
jgi:kynurenine 3-monooxygenase